MLAFFNRVAGTWPARVLFGLLAAAFVVWGVGDMLGRVGTDTAVAHVGGIEIDPNTFGTAYQQALSRAEQALGNSGTIPAALKLVVAEQTLSRLITQTVIAEEVSALGIAVPDAALREIVFAMPVFEGPNGSFDRSRFLDVLRNNGMTESEFLDLLRREQAGRQLLGAVAAGIEPPAILAGTLYRYQNETRIAEVVNIAAASTPAPAMPDEATLRRWWGNHPDRFSAPEYRRLRLIVLSPETLAKTVSVTEAEIKAAYEREKSAHRTLEQRSVEVIGTADKKVAEKLAGDWQGGLDWRQIQQAAAAAGASAIAYRDVTADELPSPALAKAVFAAPAENVSFPLKTELGYAVILVTKIIPAHTIPLAQLAGQIRHRIALEKAADLVDQQVNKLEDALAGGTSLEDLPADLGLAAAEGTLDAQGLTLSGKPAPIPGPSAMKPQLLRQVFATPADQPPQLFDGPGDSYYAFVVTKIILAAPRPFVAARGAVLADWIRNEHLKEAERKAAALLTAAQNGTPLAAAAKRAGLTAQTTKPIARNQSNKTVPAALAMVLFTMRPGEATMVQTNAGFVVAVLKKIERPDPATDRAGFARSTAALAQSMASEVENTFVQALVMRAHPRINEKLLEQLAQQ